jgi:uncharacterized protein (DUF427 family)/acyl-CoA thioesterase
MAEIESAWPRYPDYRIDLVPYEGRARVFAGNTLLAESTRALRVIETDHVERLYLPEADVHLDLLEANDHHTVCPFKGEADYWSTKGTDPAVEDVFWTYATPFDQVAGLRGYLGVYHEKVRTELESRWDDDERAACTTPFPAWGDEDDLLRLIDAAPVSEGRYEAPGYHERSRNVVEAGQLLAQAIAAVSKELPGQRVTAVTMNFARAASFDDPIEVAVEVPRRGRTFSSATVRMEQNGKLIAPALFLLDAGAPAIITNTLAMPDVPGPYESTPHDMRVTGRDLRIVNDAYSPDPDLVGPPTIYAWIRFRDDPAAPYLRQGLVAQATGHWPIAAAMRPHKGVGEADAHKTLSTGIMSASLAFHDDAPLDRWFLYATTAIWSGHGLTQGEGRVFTEDGVLLASYSLQAMVRGFSAEQAARGIDERTSM